MATLLRLLATYKGARRRLKNRLAHAGPLFPAIQLSQAVRSRWQELAQKRLEQRIASFVPSGSAQGAVLFSCAADRFAMPPSGVQEMDAWRSSQMVQTFLDLGYAVDVIDFRNRQFEPEKEYTVLVDVGQNLERLARMVGSRCLKIFHVEGAQVLHRNAGKAARLLALQTRRRVTLPALFEEPNSGIEHADCITVGAVDSENAMDPIRYAGKPIFPLPSALACAFDWPGDKDFDYCRNRFLWYGNGTGGFVAQGLDVTLEAFAAIPECHLTVCAPLAQEKLFERLYWGELYHLPNIETRPWVPASSAEFNDIVRTCGGAVFPSVAGSPNSGAFECLHAGLVPIVAGDSGVPTREFGFALANCSVGEIQETVRMVSMLGADELKRRARLSWEHARTTHTRENFAAVFRGAIVASLEWLEKRNSTFRRPHLRPVSIWRETVTPSEAVG